DDGKVEKIPMNILDDQRQRSLPTIVLPWLSHGASRRVSPKCFVIFPPIVIARQTEPTGRPKNQERRRKRQPKGPPSRLGSKPAVRRVGEDFGRIERRKIRSGKVVIPLKRRPCCINNECRQTAKDCQWFGPP